MFRAAHIAASVGRDSVIELSRRRVNGNSPAYEDNVQGTYVQEREKGAGGEGESLEEPVGRTRFSTTRRVDELLTDTYGPFLSVDTTRPLRAYCVRRPFRKRYIIFMCPVDLYLLLIQGFINALEFTPRPE